MVDSRVPNAVTPYGLPPGAFFHPSEEQLICYYLASKNSNFPRHGTDVIMEVDLYKCDPFDLPEAACFQDWKEGGRKHWYCYVLREDAERHWTATGIGYWKRRGVKDVMSPTIGRVVGKRKRFVFYLANGNSSAARTDWVMHEYELIGHPQASFVLCRVFKKPDPRRRRSVCECTWCCGRCAVTELRVGVHENAATAHPSGLQHDGALAGEANEGHASDDTDDIYNVLFGQSSGVEDQNIINPVAQQMKPFTDSACTGMDVDGLATQQLADTFTDDFVELNDLTWPPLGFC